MKHEKGDATQMHKLTIPETDCPKCGCEYVFKGPRYQELLGGADGISGVMEWGCGVCGYKLHSSPLDGKVPLPDIGEGALSHEIWSWICNGIWLVVRGRLYRGSPVFQQLGGLP